MPHRTGLIWVKFLTVRSLTRVKCPGIAWGGGGGGWGVLELSGTSIKIKDIMKSFTAPGLHELRWIKKGDIWQERKVLICILLKGGS